jgi:hypothetical protein
MIYDSNNMQRSSNCCVEKLLQEVLLDEQLFRWIYSWFSMRYINSYRYQDISLDYHEMCLSELQYIHICSVRVFCLCIHQTLSPITIKL